MFNDLSKQSRDFAIEFRKVPYALLIKKRNHGNSLKSRDLLARNSTRFICTNLGRIRSLDLMQMNLVHSVPINLFWENSLDFFQLEVRKDTICKWKSRKVKKLIERENVLNTGGPCYTRSFYLRFRSFAVQKLPFSKNQSFNLSLTLVFLFAIS
jgi:hypothetical protein